ncbi:MAG: hypothetical protein IPN29_10220 [Saprospiraceae bacterium]|nr:hypothetical protein [Saprospiraceae bacterium]
MKYLVDSQRRFFTLFQLSPKKELCNVKYEGLFSSTAAFNLREDYYEISASNVWQTKFDLFKNKRDIGDIHYNWKHEVNIRLKNRHDLTKHFILSVKSYFRFKFLLMDYQTQEIWTIKPVWRWRKFCYDFEVESPQLMEEDHNQVDEIELLTCTIYATNLLIKSRNRQ